MGSQYLADSAIETFDHAVGLGATGRNQAMIDLLLRTDSVDGMATGRFAFALSREAVSKFLAVIGEELLNFERGSLDDGFEEGLGGVSALVGLHRHIDPAGSPVDGDKQILAGRIVELGQIFHIDMDIARCVSLEGLGWSRLRGGALRLQRPQVFKAMP